MRISYLLCLLSVARVCDAFPLGGSAASTIRTRANAAVSPTKMLPSPLRFRVTSSYSTEIHLISKKYPGKYDASYSSRSISARSTTRLRLRRPLRNYRSPLFVNNLPDKNISGDDEMIHDMDDNSQNTTNATIETDENEKQSDISGEEEAEESSTLGMESGWASFGRSLLPSWTTSSTSSQSAVSSGTEKIIDGTDENVTDPKKEDSIVDVADENSTTAPSEESSIVLHTSIFSPNGTKDNEDGDDDVIDVDVLVEESERNDTTSAIQLNGVNAGEKSALAKRLLKGIMAASLQGGKKILEVSKKKIRDNSGNNDDIASTSTIDESNQATIIGGDTQETTSAGNNSTEGNENESNDVSTIESSDTNNEEVGHRGTRRLRAQSSSSNTNENSIFTSLESKDINTTTLSKQRKWERRRRRALVLVKATKNAAFLFVFTFLAGNVSANEC